MTVKTVGWEVYQQDLIQISELYKNQISTRDAEIAELKELIAVMICSMGEIRVEKTALLQCRGDDWSRNSFVVLENPMDQNTIYKWKGYK